MCRDELALKQAAVGLVKLTSTQEDTAALLACFEGAGGGTGQGAATGARAPRVRLLTRPISRPCPRSAPRRQPNPTSTRAGWRRSWRRWQRRPHGNRYSSYAAACQLPPCPVHQARSPGSAATLQDVWGALPCRHSLPHAAFTDLSKLVWSEWKHRQYRKRSSVRLRPEQRAMKGVTGRSGRHLQRGQRVVDCRAGRGPLKGRPRLAVRGGWTAYGSWRERPARQKAMRRAPLRVRAAPAASAAALAYVWVWVVGQAGSPFRDFI
jgi:hypothetical protein